MYVVVKISFKGRLQTFLKNDSSWGGSKGRYKYVCYELEDNCSSPACFSDEDSCSFSFLCYGGIWVFFGQKDSVFRSVILKNVKGPATKKKNQKKPKQLNDHKILSKTLSDILRFINYFMMSQQDRDFTRFQSFFNFFFSRKVAFEEQHIFLGAKAWEGQLTPFPFP